MKLQRNLRQTQQQKITQKQIFLYGGAGIAIVGILGSILLLYFYFGDSTDSKAAKGNQGYTSHNNYQGIWNDAGSWTKDQTWMGDIPSFTGGYAQYIDIYGYITREGDLRIGNGTTLTIYDTLRIKGNFYFDDKVLTIKPAGVLIVEGNFIPTGGTSTTIDGRMVVFGDLIADGSASINNKSDLYVLGTSSGTGGSKFNGAKNDPSRSGIGDEADLLNNDEPLYSFSLNRAGSLPVDFKDVNVSKIKNEVLVVWSTASEVNNDFFTIEASTDGRNFTQIGKQTGSGNSNQTRSYQYHYQNPDNNHRFFRIKQTDLDGKFNYSPIVNLTIIISETANTDPLQINSIGPNPFDQSFQLTYQVPTDGKVTLRLLDQQGILVVSSELTASRGFNNYEFVDKRNLKSGVYILTLTQNSVSTKPMRIIKI